MSKRIFNIVLVLLFSFFIIFFGLKIAYDTSLMDEADQRYEQDYKDKYGNQ